MHNKNSLTSAGPSFPKSEYGFLAKKGEAKTVKIIHCGWCRVIPLLFSLAGVTPDKEVVVYCQRGNRASNTFLALQSLGFPNVRNYVGSWQEWSAHPELPISVGEPLPAK